ncbi:hypothetical protein H0H93_015130 [Arthromyces matolae]|nr:hypothetical protein H0H93_015130 [Arthromyces matolae]
MAVDASFLPILSPSDVEKAAQLIQQAYAPPTGTLEDLKRLQNELFELQKRPEAWGLVIPLLEYPDQNVQFYGAHTAQVKIARDWYEVAIRPYSSDMLNWYPSGNFFLQITQKHFEI